MGHIAKHGSVHRVLSEVIQIAHSAAQTIKRWRQLNVETAISATVRPIRHYLLYD